jgi:hypothetical protein
MICCNGNLSRDCNKARSVLPRASKNPSSHRTCKGILHYSTT